ncbi:MAG: exosome 3'-_5 exonuclease subunit ski4 (Csl4) [Claussenomyces sp. TS43310]|nr:MAG: exosome 3'->5 exonuclease subunit ski4 (Csl4) [Claussenomyces sp. TS43310]
MAEPGLALAIPGQDLGPISKYQPGLGTHIHASRLYASILGTIQTSAPPKLAGPSKRPTKITPAAPPPAPPTVSVLRAPATDTKARSEVIPEVNSLVLCKVTRITPRQATVSIFVVGETVLDGEWQGLIRVQDVRATEKDRVKIFDSFRPGDVVRAIVISLGDQSSYYLSTARNDLGVIMATSELGNAMYPVSWKEYRDPETGVSESRKVAKPF